MYRFLLRRLGFAAISIIGATVVIFGLSQLAHDPRTLFVSDLGGYIPEEQWEALTKKLGYDKPVIVQYFTWLGRMLKGDLGESFGQQRAVRSVMAGKIGATMQLGMGAWIFAIMVGVPMGVLAAVRRASIFDYIGRAFALFGQATPVFWIGVMAILIFSVMLGWFPSGTRGSYRGFPFVWENLKYYILPCIVLGWYNAAVLMRLTRSAMLEILDSEYIKFARSKGVREVKIVWKHALKNSLIPPLTAAMLIMATFIQGAVVTETVFSWPGIGWLALQRAVYDNDFPLLMGCVMFFVLIYLVMCSSCSSFS
jgi:peptide/nickel transport system permease protein